MDKAEKMFALSQKKTMNTGETFTGDFNCQKDDCNGWSEEAKFSAETKLLVWICDTCQGVSFIEEFIL